MHANDPAAQIPLTPLWYNILLAMADEPRHGYGVIKEIERRTDGAMSPATGTVYLALQRLEEDGLITESADAASSEAVPADNRRRRWYELTPFGRDVLVAETRRLYAQVGVALAKGFGLVALLNLLAPVFVSMGINDKI